MFVCVYSHINFKLLCHVPDMHLYTVISSYSVIRMQPPPQTHTLLLPHLCTCTCMYNFQGA